MSRREHCPSCGCDLAAERAELARAQGRIFRARRLRRGLSLRETARRAGISAAHLSDIELGRRAWSTRVERALIIVTTRKAGDHV